MITFLCQDGVFLAFLSTMERHTFDVAKTKKSHNTRSPLITIISLIMSPESPYLTLGISWMWFQFCTESNFFFQRSTVTSLLTWTAQVKLLQWRGLEAGFSCKSALRVSSSERSALFLLPWAKQAHPASSQPKAEDTEKYKKRTAWCSICFACSATTLFPPLHFLESNKPQSYWVLLRLRQAVLISHLLLVCSSSAVPTIALPGIMRQTSSCFYKWIFSLVFLVFL